MASSHPVPKQKPKFLQCYVDGGQYGRNPSPVGVYWSVLVEGLPLDVSIRKQDKTGRYRTNNEAEWLALQELLQWAIETVPGAALVVHTDSLHVVDCFTGKKQVRSTGVIELYYECKRLAAKLPMVELLWVSRTVSVEKLGH